MLDGAHAEADAKNLGSYLKTLTLPKYGIWAMMKNKEPDIFIKQFKGTFFKKIITIPIENERSSLSSNSLLKIAKKNNLILLSFWANNYFANCHIWRLFNAMDNLLCNNFRS